MRDEYARCRRSSSGGKHVDPDVVSALVNSAGFTTAAQEPCVTVHLPVRPRHRRDDAADGDGDLRICGLAARIADAAREQARHTRASRVH